MAGELTSPENLSIRKNKWGILRDTPPEPTHHTHLCMCTLIIKQPVVVHDVDQQYDQANYAYPNQSRGNSSSHCSNQYPKDNGSQWDHNPNRDDRKCKAQTDSSVVRSRWVQRTQVVHDFRHQPWHQSLRKGLNELLIIFRTYRPLSHSTCEHPSFLVLCQ
jgi:hypothetical protein